MSGRPTDKPIRSQVIGLRPQGALPTPGQERGAPPLPGRRDALRLMAASMALVQGACTRVPREPIHAFVDLPEARAVAMPAYFATAFVRDGHAHGVLVGTRDGRPIKIEGNPRHPASLGSTDVFAQASVLQLWDPDRSSSVMERLALGASTAPPDTAARPLLVPSTWPAFEERWRQERARWARSRGAGVAILTGPSTSPTFAGQWRALKHAWPALRWYVHDPLAQPAAIAGARMAFGRNLVARRHFDTASFVITLGADPFSHSPAAVRESLDWARARRRADEHLPTTVPARSRQPASTRVARTMALESHPTLFGARADERHALAPQAIERTLWRAAHRLFADLPSPPGRIAVEEDALAARIARRLRRHGSRALIVPGPTLSARSEALIHLLHRRLGAIGRTVSMIAAPASDAHDGGLAELSERIEAGAIEALVVSDANPVFTAPGGIDFGALLDRVPLSVHHGLYVDETARRTQWHLPRTHDYEHWSDARAFDGTISLIQPVIMPLHAARSPHELLALIAGDLQQSGHEIVRDAWRERVDGDFEAFWRDALRHGLVQDSAFEPVKVGDVPIPEAPHWEDGEAIRVASGRSPVDLMFTPSHAVHEGSYANLGWLQELPHPFTRITWDNALVLGPLTAAESRLARGDRVTIDVQGRRIDAPVWIDDAYAEGAATLELGWGRWSAGRLADGVGVNAYPLRPAADRWHVRAELLRAHGRHEFARTQLELRQHRREIARTVKRGERIEESEHPSLYPPRPQGEHAWAMAIDLDACIGCNACTIACQAENNVPVVGKAQVAYGRVMHWIRVDRYTGPETGGSIFQPVPCMHCEYAPCEVVCPVAATVHDADGLNLQVYNRCIGTRFCSNNCPYKVRRFNWLDWMPEDRATLAARRNPDVTVRSRGVMEKCTYCLQRIARARQHATAHGVPIPTDAILTACQAVCPTQAIHFGDLAAPDSRIQALRRSPRHYALLGELNTRPRTTYLARIAPDAEDDE